MLALLFLVPHQVIMTGRLEVLINIVINYYVNDFSYAIIKQCCSSSHAVGCPKLTGHSLSVSLSLSLHTDWQ